MIKRLQIWGDWRSQTVVGLGYPTETPESRLLTSPGRADGQIRIPSYWPNKLAMKIQKAIRKLEDRKQNFLWCHYVGKLTPTIGAQAMGENSVQRYKEWVELSEKAAADVLNMRYWIHT